jgi:hypothetical protein
MIFPIALQGGRLSKLPVRDSRKALSPKTESTLEVAKVVIPFLISAATALWVGFQYFDSAEKDRQQRKAAQEKDRIQYERDISARVSEARKPFNELQLKTYQELALVAGILATAEQGSDVYSNAKGEFYRFYWSKLSMVEDGAVEYAMVNLERAIRNFAADRSRHQDVRARVYCLARALKASTEHSWTIHLPDAANVLNLDDVARKDCQNFEVLSSPASRLERN